MCVLRNQLVGTSESVCFEEMLSFKGPSLGLDTYVRIPFSKVTYDLLDRLDLSLFLSSTFSIRPSSRSGRVDWSENE